MKHVQLISRSLRQINHLYKKMLTKELSAFELDHHFEALLMLGIQDHPVTQNQLAELLQVDKSRVVSIIAYLEQKKLIKIEKNPADRREHYVHLSSDAVSSIPYIERSVEKINELAEFGIEDEKLATFFEVSEMIQQNLLKQAI
ncbi:MarR family winged helix-turn-helix transcriptional regulator [Mucilaginibacter polytrichastri]|nr:MarR family transcriptional regulator [Mucilaginibacter polytrichastri]SFT21821.1 DNA-binding transcriptional regulator, MarR family [Mucilaginibacter polytrichastri]